VIDIFEHLNGSDTLLGPAEGEQPPDLAQRRVLHRLGEYVEQIVHPLNMRPRSASLRHEDAERIEVRVSTDDIHITVVIAPEGDLAAEQFFIRTLSGRHLPIPAFIAADLSCSAVPFSYLIHGHIAGTPLSTVESDPLIKVAARQVGRALRSIHSHPAPGFGKPSPTGRWTTRSWNGVLGDWLGRRGVRALAADVLGDPLAMALWQATLDHPQTDWAEPRIIHGAVAPERTLATVSSAAHVEALVRPGDIVGGDPLFDLALATLPRHPGPFQQGVYEGYNSAGPISASQQRRLQRLRLLLHTADACIRHDAHLLERLPSVVESALRQLEP